MEQEESGLGSSHLLSHSFAAYVSQLTTMGEELTEISNEREAANKKVSLQPNQARCCSCCLVETEH